MPPRKRPLSPQTELDTVLPSSKKPKREATPSPPVVLSQSAGVVNEGLSDEASTISGCVPLNINRAILTSIPSSSPSLTGLVDATKTVADKSGQVDGADGVDSSNFGTPEEKSPPPSKSIPAEDGPVLDGVLPLRP